MYKLLKKFTIVVILLTVFLKDIKSKDSQSMRDIFMKLDIQDRLLSSETILERLAKNTLGREFLLKCL